MNLQEIKKAVDEGLTVNWRSENYVVEKIGTTYNIVCNSNNHVWGLTWKDGITMNEKENDFFIK
jgi:hypothetical protein